MFANGVSCRCVPAAASEGFSVPKEDVWQPVAHKRDTEGERPWASGRGGRGGCDALRFTNAPRAFVSPSLLCFDMGASEKRAGATNARYCDAHPCMRLCRWPAKDLSLSLSAERFFRAVPSMTHASSPFLFFFTILRARCTRPVELLWYPDPRLRPQSERGRRETHETAGRDETAKPLRVCVFSKALLYLYICTPALG